MNEKKSCKETKKKKNKQKTKKNIFELRAYFPSILETGWSHVADEQKTLNKRTKALQDFNLQKQLLKRPARAFCMVLTSCTCVKMANFNVM